MKKIIQPDAQLEARPEPEFKIFKFYVVMVILTVMLIFLLSKIHLF